MLVISKTIVVTGASGGVGTELVKELLKKGVKVIAFSRNIEGLKQLKIDLQAEDRLFVYSVDVSKKDDVFKAVEQMIQDHQDIDGLINNAGIIQPFIDVADLTWEKIDQVMNVNFYGQLYFIKALLPELTKRPEAHIVNIASMGGFLPVLVKSSMALQRRPLNCSAKDSMPNSKILMWASQWYCPAASTLTSLKDLA